MKTDIFSILGIFASLKVLVIGDVLIDSSVRGKAGRLSLEAPVPVVDIIEHEDLPGGAANVAANVCRLGAKVHILSVVGQDAEGDRLLDDLSEQGVEVKHVVRSATRRTHLKRRVYAGDQLVVRYDQGSSESIDVAEECQLLKAARRLCKTVDIVILSDYGQGVLNPGLLAGLADIQRSQPFLVVADTRRMDEYKGLSLAAVRPSYYSALEVLKYRKSGATDGKQNGTSNGHAYSLDKLKDAGKRILSNINTQIVAITLDDNGALVLDRALPYHRTYAPETPFNRVNGAGDAFISALALSLAAGAQSSSAAEIASAYATIVVQNGGAPACCLEELKAVLSGDQKLAQDWQAIEQRLATLRRQGKRIVFTNGVFDILHSAHVSYLNLAKSFGDILVIGVNTDESVQRLKGPSRPINNLLERSRVLAGLSCVDFVVPFGESNPINLIQVVRPDVYVKGGDYTRETLPEAEVVESLGGELRIVSYIANHSTTGVIERIRERYTENAGEEKG